MQVIEETPDGLDEVVEAYHALRRVYEAGSLVEYEVEGYTDDVLIVPGTGEALDPDDNPLTHLESWIVEQAKKGEGYVR